jgi:hypothetical protein
MSYIPDNAAVDGHGPLTVADLDARAHRALERLTATYTASSVLHDVWMAALDADDPVTREAVGVLFVQLRALRVMRRSAWRTARLAWADAAGVDLVIDDEPDDPPSLAVYLEYADDTAAGGETDGDDGDRDVFAGFRADEEPDIWAAFDNDDRMFGDPGE